VSACSNNDQSENVSAPMQGEVDRLVKLYLERDFHKIEPRLEILDEDWDDVEVQGTAYYVSVDEPGASNDNNGLFPTYQGGKDGPLKDFNARPPNLEPGDVLFIGEGDYVLDETLSLSFDGLKDRPITIRNYPGVRPVIRVQHRDLHVIRLQGDGLVLQGLEIVGGLQYGVLMKGDYQTVRYNIIRRAGFDGVKGNLDSDYGLIEENEIHSFDHEGVDIVRGDHWIVRNNIIHDSTNTGSNEEEHSSHGIFAKGGSDDILIENNEVYNIKSRWTAAIELGGTTADEFLDFEPSGEYPFEATNAIARGNEVYNVDSGVGMVSCSKCTIEDNDIHDTNWQGISIVNGEGERRDTRDSIIRNNLVYNSGSMWYMDKGTSNILFEYNIYGAEALDPYFSFGEVRWRDNTVDVYNFDEYNEIFFYGEGNTLKN
tara:strand:+ start:1583 stop:2866 length:1284 start_codon:yes stop_codon:yes gene_type:complete